MSLCHTHTGQRPSGARLSSTWHPRSPGFSARSRVRAPGLRWVHFADRKRGRLGDPSSLRSQGRSHDHSGSPGLRAPSPVLSAELTWTQASAHMGVRSPSGGLKASPGRFPWLRMTPFYEGRVFMEKSPPQKLYFFNRYHLFMEKHSSVANSKTNSSRGVQTFGVSGPRIKHTNTKADEQEQVLSKSMVLCWVALTATLGALGRGPREGHACPSTATSSSWLGFSAEVHRGFASSPPSFTVLFKTLRPPRLAQSYG